MQNEGDYSWEYIPSGANDTIRDYIQKVLISGEDEEKYWIDRYHNYGGPGVGLAQDLIRNGFVKQNDHKSHSH